MMNEWTAFVYSALGLTSFISAIRILHADPNVAVRPEQWSLHLLTLLAPGGADERARTGTRSAKGAP
jgi:hypothetical protein